MRQVNQLFLTFLLMVSGLTAFSQNRTVSGTVTDSQNEPLIGVTVVIEGQSTGTVTEGDGGYALSMAPGTYRLNFSYIGYASQTQSVSVGGSNVTLNVVMESEATNLTEVVVSVGSRTSQRTITDSPLPIDIVSSKDLASTGQTTFDRALQYRVPSFNSIQTPVNDATSLLDPYEIRNMGPSRTLVLINGKRKNMSSLIYIQTSPGRGEGGADISAIPTDAIKRVEILRDGASAQYGSDAIAGVMNIILKDRQDGGSVSLNAGITAEGDGEMIGLSLNNGASFLKKGFINYTMALSRQALANRPGKVSAVGESSDFGADISDVNNFLKVKPDAGNINGDPEKTSSRFLINAGLPVSDNVEAYANAAYVYKKVNSFANYRTPYWRPRSERADGVVDNPYALLADQAGEDYLGYVPTFEGDLTDYNGTIGFRSENNGWNSDVSFTVGGNQQLYTVANSRNRSLGINSPLVFKPGGYEFKHNVGNIDVSKMLTDGLNFGIGMEFRKETYTILKGDTASIVGKGTDSFPGTGEANATTNTRSNVGGYIDLGYDITEDFLVNGTLRFENYSDFGSTTVYKLSTRYKFMDDKVTLRASYSTGFRAPMLHQIYLQIAQQSFVPGQGIQTKGIVNNRSLQARVLGVPPLDAEKSKNFTAGIGLNPNRNLSLTLDYYSIKVEDRIVLGSEIAESDTTTTLGQILKDNGIVAISFFSNGLNTKTSGLDFVASYRNIALGSGKMTVNLAGNYVIENGLDGDVINPKLIEDAGKSIFDATQEALLFSSRPEYKVILGFDYNIGKFNINLNNTLFGPTTFRQAGLDANLKTVFQPKVVTDLGVNVELSKNLNFGVTVQNLLNVLPEYEFEALNAAGEAVLKDAAAVEVNRNYITFNNRYHILTYDGSHFSQLGTVIAGSLTLRF
ncbi:MAG: TonB-dependent receptor [Bacteroidetes bacterium]|nr:TonB-dependent receptor [Bacteroidota bacterium]